MIEVELKLPAGHVIKDIKAQMELFVRGAPI